MSEESYSSPRAEILEALQSTLQSGLDAGIPGLSAAISTSNGIIWQSTAGYANIGSQEPINSNHVFGIGSITKVFVAVVILQLVDENLLRTTDLVEDYLEDEVLQDIEHAGKATIGGLLSHTAGVESWEDDPKWIAEGRGKELDPARIWGKTDALEYIRSPSSLTPGKFSYSNTNYTLLGLIIEKITHHLAESEIRRRILTPLDLQDTYLEGFENAMQLQLGKTPHRYHYATETFRSAAGICPSFSEHGWKDNTLIDATSSNLSVEWTAGGMISSPPDLLKLAISIRDGKLLSPSSMKILQEWQTVAKDMEMGHGLFRGESPLGYGTWLGHHGSVLGFTGTLWWSEEGDCAVCVLANVGPMHAGDAPSSALQVAWESEFLQLAAKLSTKVPEDTMSIS
jgi:D-alanyl-D-alanine carboxypeptidase